MTVRSDQREWRMAEIAGHLNVFHAELVGLVADAISDNTWSGDDLRTPNQWLTIHLGVSAARAHQFLEVAQRIDLFPAIAAEFQRGALSLDQTHVVLTKAPAWADVKLVDVVTSATVPQLHKLMRKDYFDGPEEADPNEAADDTAGPDISRTAAGSPTEPTTESTADTDHLADTDDGHETTTDAIDSDIDNTANTASQAECACDGDRPTAWDRDRVTFGWNGGRFTGTFDLAADTGAVFEAALNEARDALFRDGITDVTWVDALREVCLRSLDHAPAARRDQFKTMLHVGIDDPVARTRLSNGAPIPSAVRDYLNCGGSTQPVWEHDHTPVGVGRTQRTIPTRLRNLIEYRDRGCRVPGCTNSHTEIHHIIHWADGGTTDTQNLISLCTHHHRAHHQGRFHIKGNPDQAETLTFTDRNSQTITAAPKPVIPDGPSRAGPPTHPDGNPIRYRHPSGERLDLTYFAGWTHPTIRQRHTTTWQHHNERTRAIIQDAQRRIDAA